ncbi:putative nuclease HARBI1 isoform X1 [Hyla sarda]|uniref:putative nuclease HARBI1 isoform X1 n=2 Tax=Hyla sarda TaxID=327740 RepID=UPI0024C244F7|nr:putative nuclease HARBI1 isoform X1 [Hyla sarda]
MKGCKIGKMDALVPFVIVRGQNMLLQATQPVRPIQSRNPRISKERLSLDSFTEDEVLQHFRLSKFAIQQLYDEIKENIDSKTQRSNAIRGMTKVIAVLHYLASGSFQYCIAGKLGFTQPTFSRILRQVVEAIGKISNQYVRFPYTADERAKIKEQFFNKFGMPLTVGLIDCTHIAILPPSAIEQSYRNRKMFHSINVQVICGPNGKILDIVARYPGGTHDSFILNSSGIGNLFKTGYFNEDLLLGDNGYGLTTWLLTPYLFPRNEAHQKYYLAHRRTRSRIERVFGQWKSRF